MKRILGIAMVLGLVGVLTMMIGCSKEKDPLTKQEQFTGKVESALKDSFGKVDVIDFGEGVKLEMVLIPAGKFKMGNTKKGLEELKKMMIKENWGQAPRKGEIKKDVGKEVLDYVDKEISSQGRQHEVTLTKPFYMGKYEVTQEQWQTVMGNEPSFHKSEKFPVNMVSWADCQEFIKKLNSKTDGGYRLPTEAEWEYACRAGTTTVYSFSDKITPKDANFRDSEIRKPIAVGSYKPNAFGLYDMHGNVGEWCEDWADDYPFAVTDPKGPATGQCRILRGGSFLGQSLLVGSSFRDGFKPTFKNDWLGFRLARTP